MARQNKRYSRLPAGLAYIPAMKKKYFKKGKWLGTSEIPTRYNVKISLKLLIGAKN